ncbi:tRNA-modifying protein YgfZ [Photobacterium ganghwense]|uniref:tRNA-modifying protein YgfZ n=1 Tax=Photobacterium ganghwense TaxID=320778 RepID=A0A0J1H455_9GAMM|nr:tRNA-modifying protein YgfZ [Photobacterium ganghwense]KLV06561.1 tRNA-modifying protein [Photobacterium ganghwense]PSU06793.1 tRNA-modifying protein YgfZ [Photobacterium ganghwense]QSV14538.1 tRNA-modifying protein YgfZ [Photobacterium ganghwense]
MSTWSETLHFDTLSLAPADPLPALALVDLASWALVTLVGDDKKSYLHGQVTCDVVSLAADQSTLGGHCDAKGKMRTIFRLFHHHDGYGFVQRRSVMATQLPELKKYAVFSKVDIAESNDVLLGLTGSDATARIDSLFGGSGDVRPIPGGTAVKVDDQRWLLAVEPAQAQTLAEQLSDAILSDDTLWDLYDIRAAIPRVDGATELEFIPQAVNLQALDGISFKKGCYTGQETVARAKYRGINKRAMYIVSGPAARCPQAGDALERSVGENWRKGGTIIAGYLFNDGTAIALVGLPNDLEEDTQFRLAEQEGIWHKLPLPYSLEENA